MSTEAQTDKIILVQRLWSTTVNQLQLILKVNIFNVWKKYQKCL